MNAFITEICSLVPTCAAISRKLDKLTVLRLAVQHIKTIRGSSTSYGREIFKPNIVADDQLKTALRKIFDGFILAVNCEDGKILHVSDNVVDYLGWNRDDLIGRSFVDIVYGKDTDLFKQQLNCTFQMSTGNDKFFTQKTSRVTKDSQFGTTYLSTQDIESSIFSSGAKRSFCCRMNSVSEKTFVTDKTGRKIVQEFTKDTAENFHRNFFCCGFLKSWLQATEISTEFDNDEIASVTCLVVLAKLITTNDESATKTNLENILRVDVNGTILEIDNNFSVCFGYSKRDIIGSNFFEHIHNEEFSVVKDYFNKGNSVIMKNIKTECKPSPKLHSPRNFGLNKSVTISTSEPISPENQDSIRTHHQFISPGNVIDISSPLSHLKNESTTALSVVMNILQAENCLNNGEYCETWSL